MQNINGTKIDISFLSNGLYICKIKSSKKVSTEKIIKQ
ncbi:MAG: T9SS type A sorting domain-containing protein [Bacteroidota bacterium]